MEGRAETLNERLEKEYSSKTQLQLEIPGEHESAQPIV